MWSFVLITSFIFSLNSPFHYRNSSLCFIHFKHFVRDFFYVLEKKILTKNVSWYIVVTFGSCVSMQVFWLSKSQPLLKSLSKKFILLLTFSGVESFFAFCITMLSSWKTSCFGNKRRKVFAIMNIYPFKSSINYPDNKRV